MSYDVTPDATDGQVIVGILPSVLSDKQEEADTPSPTTQTRKRTAFQTLGALVVM